MLTGVCKLMKECVEVWELSKKKQRAGVERGIKWEQSECLSNRCAVCSVLYPLFLTISLHNLCVCACDSVPAAGET